MRRAQRTASSRAFKSNGSGGLISMETQRSNPDRRRQAANPGWSRVASVTRSSRGSLMWKWWSRSAAPARTAAQSSPARLMQAVSRCRRRPGWPTRRTRLGGLGRPGHEIGSVLRGVGLQHDRRAVPLGHLGQLPEELEGRGPDGLRVLVADPPVLRRAEDQGLGPHRGAEADDLVEVVERPPAGLRAVEEGQVRPPVEQRLRGDDAEAAAAVSLGEPLGLLRRGGARVGPDLGGGDLEAADAEAREQLQGLLVALGRPGDVGDGQVQAHREAPRRRSRLT